MDSNKQARRACKRKKAVLPKASASTKKEKERKKKENSSFKSSMKKFTYVKGFLQTAAYTLQSIIKRHSFLLTAGIN